MSTPTTSTAADPTAPSAPAGGLRRWWPFTRHFLEMVLTMWLGMIVLDPLWRLGLHTAGVGGVLHNDTVMALVMATDMCLGMGAWMRYRGHRWRPIVEMSAAMYLPFVIFFPFVWAGAMSGEAMLGAGHGLMLLAMLAVMLWRRDEYTGCHAQHSGHGRVTR